MKKSLIIAIVLIVGAIGAVYLFYTHGGTNQANTGPTTTSADANFHPDPSNATFIFNDGPITLSNGKDDEQIAPGSAVTEETTLLDKFAYGDLNNDGKGDTALLLARFGGGSGTFIYLAAYVSGPINYKGSGVAFIGDRVSPQSISISGNTITVNYLDRKPDEPFSAEPTVPSSKQFIYADGNLQEK